MAFTNNIMIVRHKLLADLVKLWKNDELVEKIDLSDMVNTTTLVLGISTLIVAEVFAIGLKMKEEQELTI